MLKAVPPKGHKLTSADLDRSVSIMREPRRQARRLRAGDPQAGHRPDRDPARRRPRPRRRRRAIIGKTAQLELYDLEAARSAAARSTRAATRSPKPTLYDLLARCRRPREGHAAGYYCSSYEVVTTTTKHDEDEGTTVAVSSRAKATPRASRQPATEGAAAEPYDGKLPTDDKVLAVPARTGRLSCVAPRPVCPGGDSGVPPPGTDYYLFKHVPNRYATTRSRA